MKGLALEVSLAVEALGTYAVEVSARLLRANLIFETDRSWTLITDLSVFVVSGSSQFDSLFACQFD